MKKENKFNSYKVVELPHIRAAVYFLDIKELKGVKNEESGFTCILGESKEDSSIEIGIFYQDIEELVKHLENAPLMGHEIFHAIQILCEQRAMKIENEVEHLAYIFHYLFEQLLAPQPKK